jgi:hypothetical protein
MCHQILVKLSDIKFNENVFSSSQVVGFEVFTAVVLKSIFFWDMTPCSALSGTTQRTTRRHILEEDTLQFSSCFMCTSKWTELF